MSVEHVTSLSQLQDRLLHEPGSMEGLLLDLSINVTSMFRDPTFYAALREKVAPVLHTYPFTRIWCAGCSTGEEVYSLAILLQEEGLYEHTRIYATDINENVLPAREGVFPLERMKQYTQNYLRGGGKRDFSEYYVAAYDGARFSRSLLDNVVFAQHNLAMDGVFNEFNLILCRNVMIYFDRICKSACTGCSTTASSGSASSHSATRSRSRSAASRAATKRSTQKSASTAELREVYDVIVIGASWGGLRALSRLLDGLDEAVHQPIVVAQHRSAERTTMRSSSCSGSHAAHRLRPGRQDSARARPRLHRPARLSRARRERSPRVVDRRAGSVRTAVDRRPVRLCCGPPTASVPSGSS